MEKNQLLIVIIANSVEKFLNKQKSKKKYSKKLRTSINAQKVNLKNVINNAIVKERIK